MVEEDLAIEIAFGKSIGTRIEFFAIARRLDAERIELGVEMTAHAVGADQHQGADRIPRRLVQVGSRNFGTLGLCLGSELGADRLLYADPVAIEREGQFVARRQRPVGAPPGSAFGVLLHVGGAVLQAFEELLPVGIDRGRILLVAGI